MTEEKSKKVNPTRGDKVRRNRRAHFDVVLPWPPLPLSPNHKVHWAIRRRAVADYKKQAWALALEATHGRVKRLKGRVDVEMHFYPPTAARRDEDNLIASMKAGIDGLAAAIATDDCQFHYREIHVHDKAPPGYVLLRVFFLKK